MNLILSQSDVRTFIELVPQFPVGEWWQLLLMLVLVGCVLAFVVFMYWADSVELPRGLAVLLTTLRILAFGGLLLFFMNPEKRSETRIVKNSRLSLLVDTSLSMGLSDTSKEGAPSKRRIDDVIDALESSDVVKNLQQHHDLAIYRFGEQNQPEPIASLPKSRDQEPANASLAVARQSAKTELARSAAIARVAMFFLIAFIVVGAFYASITLFTSYRKSAAWFLLVSTLCLVVGVIGLGIADVSSSQFDFWTSIGWQEPNSIEREFTKTSGESRTIDTASPTGQIAETDIVWKEQLQPTGTATRLGAAIQHIINKERGGPIAGIVVVSDGRNNAGSEPSVTVASAVDAGIPIYSIGVGSNQRQKNVSVADIRCPPRVFPGDKFSVRALIQGVGFDEVKVELVSVDEKETEAEEIEAERVIKLLPDAKPVPVNFDVQRNEEGKRRYFVRVKPDESDLDARDNQRSELVEIVRRKTKVLLIAGGPTREFRFLRNQLFRDADVVLDVWLQTAKKGADQESNKLLFDFPADAESMFDYDCLIAFDPEWRALSEQQAELLERWVSQKAGGLIVVAGPVYTPEWTRRPRGDSVIDRIRRLYPVSFYSQGTATLKLGRFGGEKPFPLEFSREGRAAEFLWIADTASDNQTNWARFKGVYGYYAVNEAKLGADILAYFADPTTMVNDRLPIYQASHFYGSGRVFFQASGEMWRIREVDVDYFEQFYTKLIRWVSQGRLLRDSNRGVLLVDRQRCWVGDQVVVRALLRDPRDEPLMAKKVECIVRAPDGSTKQLTLRSVQDVAQPGTFVGQLNTGTEGDYRVSLAIPESPEGEVIWTQVQAAIPDLEKQRPERNDNLLGELAEKTGGHYFIGIDQIALDPSDPLSLVSLIQPQDQETFLPGTPDRQFTRRLMMWLLGLISLVFGLEWTFRRLHKLA